MSIQEWVQAISLVIGAIGLVVCACVGLYFVGVPPHLYLTFVLGMLSGGILTTIFWSWSPQLLVDVEGEFQKQGDRFEVDQQIEDELDRVYQQGFSEGYYACELETSQNIHDEAS
jgi:hypothetical protein